MLTKMLSVLAIGFFLSYANGDTKMSINDKIDQMFEVINKLEELPDIKIPRPIGFNISNPPHVELYEGLFYQKTLYRTNDSSVTVFDNGDIRADLYFGSQKITVQFGHAVLNSPTYSGPASFTSTKNSFHVGIDAKFDRDTLECTAKVTDFHIVQLDKVKFASTEFSGKDVSELATNHALPAVNEELMKSTYKDDFERDFRTAFCRRLQTVFSIIKSGRVYRSASWLSTAIESIAPEDLWGRSPLPSKLQ